ncbi:MAG TPA: hypothetical protein PLP06_06185 [Saprospiraceae bacterium]|nr:hypothetical protein [Saprospiraceae bacterium]
MKNFLIFIALAFSSLQLQGQVSESVRNMSAGDNNSLSIIVNGIEPKDVESVWEKFTKQYDGKQKYNRKAKELMIDNATIKTLSDNTVDVYSKAERVGDATQFTLWFDLGGAYLNSKDHPERYQAAVTLLNEFDKETKRFVVNQQLKEAEKALSKLEDQQKSLVKDKEGLEKDIKKAEDKIQGWKKDIDKSVNDQAAKASEIEKQKAEVDRIKTNLSGI